ncbi:peptidyl-prolyl cis-trans isomerase [Cytobacillus firmus]|uniref:peptidyl-prolyl cis-trans isomerase n=1 Tax=Cytobacillus firmus TaxID=1399 RepID=UPI001C986302|nr:peptidyl-prolyl cis-trans isomerase [Cytobacillus firmus]MBY6054386.1 peptidyl-prolyl cis-trans isomerase [Cytobacillus firmus]URT71032.1 peptidyl-prolyl cis-trans isomerase [Cytobacillus firmus]WHY34317.1 peptidyl-prolyl cis-trans isomerase [Cytobacillus firmus]WHY61933.1 peptidyl-prolyl cis-trans isomerase [Cytobacillus firmus]
MEKRQLLMIIAGLVLLNLITLAFLLFKGDGSREAVAKIGGEKITRQDWMSEMETKYGKSTLSELIDQKVIEEAGEKYGVKISDKAVDLELKMVKTMYGGNFTDEMSEDKWRRQIKNNLILEELLTSDVSVSEEEMKSYYEENSSQFHIPDTYHISQIIVKTKEEAEQTVKELEEGSSFSVLAMERSIDEFTANLGGNAGYVSEDDEHIPAEVLEQVKDLKPGKWTKPVKTEDGYAVVMLHEHLKGEKYSFKEVKNMIRRQIALEQMDVPVSAKPFWKETDVEWFYGEQ